MKTLYFFAFSLCLIFLCGCANTYGLNEQQQLLAIEKYPWHGLNIVPSDSDFMTAMKITGRVLVCPLTLGASEIVLLDEREETFRKYAEFLYYNSFLDKPCGTVIEAFGAPTRITTDGKGGNI